MADELSIQINNLIDNGKSPVIALSGGTTPSPVYQKLVTLEVNWNKCNSLWEMIDVSLLEVRDVI